MHPSAQKRLSTDGCYRIAAPVVRAEPVAMSRPKAEGLIGTEFPRGRADVVCRITGAEPVAMSRPKAEGLMGTEFPRGRADVIYRVTGAEPVATLLPKAGNPRSYTVLQNRKDS